jgi:hypothetical protein
MDDPPSHLPRPNTYCECGTSYARAQISLKWHHPEISFFQIHTSFASKKDAVHANGPQEVQKDARKQQKLWRRRGSNSGPLQTLKTLLYACK